MKRAWHGELARSNRERPTDGTDPDPLPVHGRGGVGAHRRRQLAALDGWHLWTPVYAESRLEWRPTKPLTVLLLRACGADRAVPAAAREPAYGGCSRRSSWPTSRPPPT